MRYRISPISYGVIIAAVVLHLIAACTPTNNGTPSSLAKNDPAVNTYLELSKGYLARNNIKSAFENAQKAVTVGPDNAEAHTLMGLILQRSGDSNNAAKHYVKAKKLSPYDPFVTNAYGTYLCNNGLYGEADREFMTAARSPLNNSPWVAYTNAGLCYERNGQYSLARQRIQSALATNSKFPQALSAMKRLRGRG